MIRNSEEAIVAAMQEMIAAKLPVKEFLPHKMIGKSLAFSWIFERDITPREQKKVVEISNKYFDADYSVKN